ncbi:DEAD/DEAH box helicase family protein [Candidatus Pacearchaeota archaeon]|nr:DEAD/DEAH box helicase family protein [Candidatus Pacearchaeota archaeon]
MKRLNFGPDGRLLSVDGKFSSFPSEQSKNNGNERERTGEKASELKRSDSLEFLKDDGEEKTESVFDRKFWSLYRKEKNLEPLKFSNGKTQEDVVQEIVELIEKGKKVIFLHGVCGTGKSAIALNIARALGKTAIVVPVKGLQKQYEQDYMGNMHLTKRTGKKMKIAMITGRENHDSIIEPGKSCAHPYLPDTIKIVERNKDKLKRFYQENPFVSSNAPPSMKRLRRISIAPANPYWSPILPAEIEINQLRDAEKKKYLGMRNREFIFYHRKKGCSYYDQYLAYLDADVVIFNSAKYLAEVSLGRKPQTEVDIIDEADEFLDKFSNSVELNLTRLAAALRTLVTDSEKAKSSIKKAVSLIDIEETNKRALGINEGKVYPIEETKIGEILKEFLFNPELEAEIEIDDMNYGNAALEAAKDFYDSLKDTYLTYRKEEDNLFARLVTTNLAKKFKEIVDGNKALVLMSGTLHSDEVLRNIFGIEDYGRVEAETLNQGSIEIMKTGKEFDCRYANFYSGRYTREEYLQVLENVVARAEKPALVHVNAFSDLPNLGEAMANKILNLSSSEELKTAQGNDKTGEAIIEFKKGKNDTLFTTKCSRGIDFPGDTCKSVVFTKYPNPNVKDTFWQILEKTHPDYYWEFYRDKARREFLQRIYRAVRSKDDHVYVLSPDSRVLDAVRLLQEEELGKK